MDSEVITFGSDIKKNELCITNTIFLKHVNKQSNKNLIIPVKKDSKWWKEALFTKYIQEVWDSNGDGWRPEHYI
jgi:hypothetical protein